MGAHMHRTRLAQPKHPYARTRVNALVEEGEERRLRDGLDRRRLLLRAVEDVAALADLVHVAVGLLDVVLGLLELRVHQRRHVRRVLLCCVALCDSVRVVMEGWITSAQPTLNPRPPS